MFTDYYGLSFNPFDKQCIKERDAFRSQDHRQMQSRLDYLKTVRGIGRVYSAARNGQDLCAAMLHERPELQPVPDGIHQPVHDQRDGVLPSVAICWVWSQAGTRRRCSKRSRSVCIICTRKRNSR